MVHNRTNVPSVPMFQLAQQGWKAVGAVPAVQEDVAPAVPSLPQKKSDALLGSGHFLSKNIG